MGEHSMLQWLIMPCMKQSAKKWGPLALLCTSCQGCVCMIAHHKRTSANMPQDHTAGPMICFTSHAAGRAHQADIQVQARGCCSAAAAPSAPEQGILGCDAARMLSGHALHARACQPPHPQAVPQGVEWGPSPQWTGAWDSESPFLGTQFRAASCQAMPQVHVRVSRAWQWGVQGEEGGW